jgi:dTMP kinase
MLRHVLNFATGGLLPDVTLYLEITPEDALKRRAEATLFGADWNRLDDMDLEFHRRVYKGYRELLLAEPARFVEIDALGTPEAVQGAIRKKLAEWLDLPRIPHENGHNTRHGQSK